MMTFDEFELIVGEEMELLPDYVYKDLNGVFVDDQVYLHPGSLADDLYIFGIYKVSPVMGKQIILYYGSFMKCMGHCSYSAIRTRIRETLRHEFRHHLETNAGLFGRGTLIEEDRNGMRRYYMSHREDPEKD